MNKEMLKENAKRGIITGILLFLSCLIVVSLSDNPQGFRICMKFFILILACYIAIGVLYEMFRHRERKTAEKIHYHNAGGLYISQLYIVFFAITTTFLPRTLGIIFWSNLSVLFLLWLSDYLYLKAAAKKLNTAVNFVEDTLVIEVPEKLSSLDDLYEFLTQYCSQNQFSLQIDRKELPGEIMLNQKLYTVNQEMDYSIFGMPAYALILTAKVTSSKL